MSNLTALSSRFETSAVADVCCIPLLPSELLRDHQIFVETDTRFRAAARLLQSLWRDEQGLAIGYFTDPKGRRRKLGSRLNVADGRQGANFFDPAIASLVRRELAYREIGALYDVERLLQNLLSSMPLTFNLLAPLKLDLGLATNILELVLPHFEGEVVGVHFEHSPGRGAAAFIDDHSAFDALIRYRNPAGGRGFVAVEVKYTEAMIEPVPAMRARYDEVATSSGLFVDAHATALRINPLQQLFREHLLAQSMLNRGLYDEGTFVLIAPTLNHRAQQAAQTYATHLQTPGLQHARFTNLTLEQVIGALSDAGEQAHAQQLFRRYCDWSRIDEELERCQWGGGPIQSDQVA